MSSTEKELEILRTIYERRDVVRQRDLAVIVGLSLGMTNSILKRLVQKGWLKVRKVNNRNIRYIVSPSGIEEITRRSYRYFKRTIKNVVFYKDAIENLIRDIKSAGYEGIILVGASDLDFIVEHGCLHQGIRYVKNPDTVPQKVYYIYSETYLPDDEEKDNTSFLQDLFLCD